MTKIRASRKLPMYRVDLSLAWMEALDRGECPEGLSQYAHDCLRWKREAIRATTKVRTRTSATKKKKKFIGRA